jgi:sialate O-acetylesterase
MSKDYHGPLLNGQRLSLVLPPTPRPRSNGPLLTPLHELPHCYCVCSCSDLLRHSLYWLLLSDANMMRATATARGQILSAISACVAALLLLVLPIVQPASALWLPNLFSSNMVLQRGKASIWGLATPGAPVSVSLDGLIESVVAEPVSGYWLYSIVGTVNSTSHTLTVSSENATVSFLNVAFGDVFLCSGQSNMQINLMFSFGGAEAIAQWASYPNVRLFNIPQQVSSSPLTETNITFAQGWVLPSPDTLDCGAGCLWNQFSAVCWTAGRDLYDSWNGTVPIGLLHASYGGTAASTWTSNGSVLSCGPLPAFPDNSTALRNPPSGAYNAMIHPLLPLSLSAVLWYQVRDGHKARRLSINAAAH